MKTLNIIALIVITFIFNLGEALAGGRRCDSGATHLPAKSLGDLVALADEIGLYVVKSFTSDQSQSRHEGYYVLELDSTYTANSKQ